jgi:hypothetical protein
VRIQRDSLKKKTNINCHLNALNIYKTNFPKRDQSEMLLLSRISLKQRIHKVVRDTRRDHSMMKKISIVIGKKDKPY